MSCYFKSILKDVYQKVQINYALILILFVSVLLRLLYIDAPLLDIHSFRQTQVAISVQYLLNHGLSFDNIYNYKTPVFGSPWMVPFEAPIFQVSAFVVHKVLSILFFYDNLDISLRITNIVYFYLSAYVLYLLVKFVTNKEIAFITFLLYLFMPFSIFWSRTSMIEFCATFFSISYLYNFIIYSQRRTLKNVVYAVIFGIFGYLAKSTSMVPSCIFICLYYFIKVKPLRLSYIKNYKFVLSEILMVAIPFICGYLWVSHTDYIKSMSVATQHLTSESLKNWNFGTLPQKLNLNNWDKIYFFIKQQWGKYFVLLVLSYFVFLTFESLFRKKILKEYHFCIFSISLISILLTIFTFFNLYFVHNYYHIAVNYLECIMVAISISLVLHKIQFLSNKLNLITARKYVTYTIFLLLFSCLARNVIRSDYINYFSKHDWYVGPNSYSNFVLDVSKQISEITSNSQSIILEGFAWGSEVPYYSNRKALMLVHWNDKNEIDKLISSNLKDYATFICNNDGSDRLQIVLEILESHYIVKEIKICNRNVSYFVLAPK